MCTVKWYGNVFRIYSGLGGNMENQNQFVPSFSNAHLNKVHFALTSLRLKGKYNLCSFSYSLILRPQRINIMSINL